MNISSETSRRGLRLWIPLCCDQMNRFDSNIKGIMEHDDYPVELWSTSKFWSSNSEDGNPTPELTSVPDLYSYDNRTGLLFTGRVNGMVKQVHGKTPFPWWLKYSPRIIVPWQLNYLYKILVPWWLDLTSRILFPWEPNLSSRILVLWWPN